METEFNAEVIKNNLGGQSENDLNSFILNLLLGNDEFTDIHIQAHRPVMLRYSSMSWVPANTASMEPFVVSKQMFDDLLTNLLAANGTDEDIARKKGSWREALTMAGSILPAVTLWRPDGPNRVLECRVRCTITSHSMGMGASLVIRPLRSVQKNLKSLGLPLSVGPWIHTPSSGLIVVTGPTGSGKSTTLAAMINEINETRSAHIITIEDPVEIIHECNKSIITQREIGVDVLNYEMGIKDALRSVPDVIMIGEIRNKETMAAAVRAGESGHLVLTSMHAPTTMLALKKMIAYLDDSSAQVQSLAACLNGVIAQHLLQDKDVISKKHLAYEILNCRNQKVTDAIIASTADGGNQKLSDIENSLKNSQLDNQSSPLFNSLTSIRAHVDPRRILGLPMDMATRASLMRA